MCDDELNDELGPFSKLNLSQEKRDDKAPLAVDMKTFESLFLNLSVSKDGEISLSSLEDIVSDMKAKAQNSISLATLLSQLDLSNKNNVNESSESNKSSDTQDDVGDQINEESDNDDNEDDESISSSLNSSWAESPKNSSTFNFQQSPLKKPPSSSTETLPSPPVKFDFKTPQKIFHDRKKNSNVEQEEKEKKEESEVLSNVSNNSSPGFVVDSSPPPNFFDRKISASASGSVFGPPDDALLPNKPAKTQNINNNGPTVPLARTLFSNTDTSTTTASTTADNSTDPPLTSSLFNGSGASTVTFDMGKSNDKGKGPKGNKRSLKAKGAGKSQMSQNRPTTNFQAFQSAQLPNPPPPPSSHQSTTNPSVLNPNIFNTTFPPRPEEHKFPSPSPMDMEQSPSDHSKHPSTFSQQHDDKASSASTTEPTAAFSFSMGSDNASSKQKSGVRGSHRKNRRGKTSPASAAVDPASSKMATDSTSSFHTSPIKTHYSSSMNSSLPDADAALSEENPQTPEKDTDEVDSRMISLANLFKKEGKQLYNSERYEMAYDAFSKALKAAPDGWKESSNVLSNRAAALMMLERIVEAVEDCEKSAALDATFLKVHSRRGRALFKLGRIDEATAAFQHVLSAPISEEEEFQNSQLAGADYAGRTLARAAMKQIVLAKSLLASLDRLQRNQDPTMENSDTNPATKVYMQSAEELLALCPYMREAQVHRSRALAMMHQWEELKDYTESCVLSIHQTMQAVDAHPLVRFPLGENLIEELQWVEDSREAGKASIDHALVKNFLLGAGPGMAEWYVVALKNQSLCRTSCSSSIMRILVDILSDLRVEIEGAHVTDSLLNDNVFNSTVAWQWLLAEVTKISNTLALKKVADEKFRLGQFAEAIKSYSAVLQVDPNAHIWNAIMFGNRAAASMRLRLYADAVSDCQQSLGRDPLYARAYLRRARAQRELGHHAASIRDFKKYLKTTPRPADSLDVQMELEEVTNAKIEEELLMAAKKKREAAEAREREWRQRSTRERETFEEQQRRRGQTNESRNASRRRDNFEDSQRENYSNQQRHQRQPPQPSKSSSRQTSKSSSKTESTDSTPQPEINSENFYVRLGVSSNADMKAIKVAYRKMALKYHPDKNKDNATATELFKKVTEAYSTLSDTSARRTYDATTLVQENSRGGGRNSRRYGW